MSSSSSTAEQPSQAYLDQYSGYTLVGVSAFLITIETILVILRFYARRVGKVNLGYDDAVLPLGWLANLGCNIVAINSVYKAGVGRHVPAVVAAYGMSWVAPWAKSIFALEILYLAGAALPKLSIILLYLRIFVTPLNKWICRGLLAYTILVWVAFTIANSLQCIPLRYSWDKTISGHCFNVQAYYKTTSAPNILSDLIMATLPLPTLWKLHTSLGRKIGLVLVFLTGSIGVVGSCVRMSTFFRYDAFTDNTWVSVTLIAWTCVEPGMYLVAACMLGLGPLVNKIPIKALRSKHGSSYPEKEPKVTQGSQRPTSLQPWNTAQMQPTGKHDELLDTSRTGSVSDSVTVHGSTEEIDVERGRK